VRGEQRLHPEGLLGLKYLHDIALNPSAGAGVLHRGQRVFFFPRKAPEGSQVSGWELRVG